MAAGSGWTAVLETDWAAATGRRMRREGATRNAEVKGLAAIVAEMVG